MQNIFENPAFSMSALTAAINILPNNYGLMDSMGLFPSKPVRFRSVVVEEKNGILTLLPTMPVGSPGMDGPAYGNRRDPYDVLLVARNGSTRVFKSYHQAPR